MIKEKMITQQKEISINVVQTEIESIRKKDIKRTGLRLIKDNCIGIAGKIGQCDEKDLEAKAEKALEMKLPYPYEVSENKQETWSKREEIIADEDFAKEITELLAEIKAAQPDFSFGNRVSINEVSTELSNNKGLDLKYEDRFLSFGLTFKEKTSANIMDGYVGFGGRKYDRKKALELVNEICNAFKNPVDLPEKEKLPIIFSKH